MFRNSPDKRIFMRGSVAVCLFIYSAFASAATVTLATAANFKPTLEHLAAIFEARSQHRVRIVSASTGVLYNQILHGAPFDVFLSADAASADKIARSKQQTARAYAFGVLVYWQPCRASRSLSRVNEASLRAQTQTIAIANAILAPYGRATQEVLARLNLEQRHIVTGNNVNQTHQFVASGNAQGGFVAWSQVIEENPADVWIIPPAYYAPIEQKAVLLNPDNIAAVSFVDFLHQDATSAIIRQHGYQKPASTAAITSLAQPAS